MERRKAGGRSPDKPATTLRSNGATSNRTTGAAKDKSRTSKSCKFGVKLCLFVSLGISSVAVFYSTGVPVESPSSPPSASLVQQQQKQQQPPPVDNNAPKVLSGSGHSNDDRTATVMGMATGYSTDVYSKFVGSLRRSGYRGHIILGVAPDIGADAKRYLESRNVIMKPLSYTNCTYEPVLDPNRDREEGHTREMLTCAHPYPDIKIRWSRFPLQRDWLLECDTCTGPVLTIDIRDSVFQGNPFGDGSPPVEGLQVFEESPARRTTHWLVDGPLQKCKGVKYNETMLCSGSTIGTREAILEYFEKMYDEMKQWIVDPKCRFAMNGDDQTIHNYLYYSGRFGSGAKAVPNRYGIVHTLGVDCAHALETHKNNMVAQGRPRSDGNEVPFPGARGNDWLGNLGWVKRKEQDRDFTISYDVTNSDGFVINADHTVSRVVHQFDRCGPHALRWLAKQYFFQDK